MKFQLKFKTSVCLRHKFTDTGALLQPAAHGYIAHSPWLLPSLCLVVAHA